MVGQPASTQLVQSGSFGSNWSVHNTTVVYRDTNSILAPMRVVSAHSTSPQSYPLETAGTYLQDLVFNDDASGGTYAVWTQSISSGNSTRNKIFSAKIPSPLTAAPQITPLGTTIPSGCSYWAVLSDTTYWQLCYDTGTLTGYPESTTSGSVVSQVRFPLWALPDGDSVAYRKYDGKLYTSPNTGALNTARLVSETFYYNQNNPFASVFPVGKGMAFRDVSAQYMRSSAADGSANDQPLTSCVPTQQDNNYQGYFTTDPARTHAWWFGLQCTDSFGDFYLPAAGVE